MIKRKEYSLERLRSELSDILRLESGLSQADIAEKANIDQSYVSRASNGRLRRMTRRARHLAVIVDKMHATMRNRKSETPKQIDEAVKSYLALGGDPDLLVLQVDVLRKAIGPIRRAEPLELDEPT